MNWDFVLVGGDEGLGLVRNELMQSGPVAAPFTLTLTLSHRGRGDVIGCVCRVDEGCGWLVRAPRPPPHAPASSLRLLASPF